MARTRWVMLAAILLPSSAAAPAPDATVEGGGVVDGGSPLCGGIIPVAVELAMTREDSWEARIAASSLVPPCAILAAATCTGVGTLATGVSFEACEPEGSGALGPVVLCLPGPQREPPDPVVTTAVLDFSGQIGGFGGEITVALLGDAPNEAANLCD